MTLSVPNLRSRARRRLLVAGAVCASLAATPAAALAADAPVRTIARDLAGNATASLLPVAVSNDGREVIANLGDQAVVRDVAAGTTKALFGKPNVYVRQATPDLRFVLVDTVQQLIPSDTDGGEDLLLLDRQTGVITKVTDVPTVLSDGRQASFAFPSAEQVSGDGRTVGFVLRLSTLPDATHPEVDTENVVYRYDRLTDTATRLRTVPETHWGVSVVHRDTAGRVLVTGAGAIVDGTRLVPLPLPATDHDNQATAAISNDGGTIALTQPGDLSKIDLISTATGAVSSIPVPSGLAANGYDLLNVTAGGGFVIVRDRYTSGANIRQRVGRLSRSGVVTQIGGDIPALSSTPAPIPSDTLSFAANGLYLAKLGSPALPGAEPPAAAQVLSTYMTYQDTHCANGPYSVTNYRATVTLASTPKGIDPRTPASASVKVFKTGTPSTLYNVFTMAAGATRELTVPVTGGWTYAATITFTDGSTMNGSYDVAPHAKQPCDPFYWF